MTEENMNINDAISEAFAELTADVESTDIVAEEATEVEALEEDNLDTEAEAVAEVETEEVEAEADDEEESEESEEEVDETEAEEDEEETGVIELDGDMEVIIDGQRVKVSDALQMRSDYTRKTQELSEERTAFETEKQEMSEQLSYLSNLSDAWEEDPVQVVSGLAGNTENPVETIARAVKDLAMEGEVDANLVVVKTIIGLVGSDLLDDELRLQLGFDDDVVAKLKEQVKQDERIERLERQARKPKAQAPAEEEDRSAAIANARAAIEKQWNDVVASEEELQGLDEAALQNVRIEVAKFALDKGGIPMDVAYQAMQVSKLKAEREASKAKAEAARKAKAKTRVSGKPSTAAPASAPRDPQDLGSAIEAAMRDLQGKG